MPSDERDPVPDRQIEPWELHSELVLVCPEVCERARKLLPERDPDAFLATGREPVLLPATRTIHEPQQRSSLLVALVGYAVWRLLETARIALFTLTAVIVLALLAELLH
jgi:hypothetical protein